MGALVLFAVLLTLGALASLDDDATNSAQLQGLAIGSRVTRGPDWRYQDQDGGDGKLGTVIGLRQWRGGSGPDVVAATVIWDANGHKNAYRWSKTRPQDVSVVGWRPLPPDLLAVRSADEEEATYYRKQRADAAAVASLQRLYTTWHGAQWTAARGWRQDPPSDPCTDGWEGVACKDGMIIGLDLSSNGLNGSFSGAGLAAVVTAAPKLRSLNVARNQLSGAIPPEICKLKHLEFLDVSNNALSGPLPACIGKELSGTLTWLAAAGNKLSGTIPPEYAALKKLTALHLHGNAGLSGLLPGGLDDSPQLRSVSLPPTMKRRSLTFGVTPAGVTAAEEEEAEAEQAQAQAQAQARQQGRRK